VVFILAEAVQRTTNMQISAGPTDWGAAAAGAAANIDGGAAAKVVREKNNRGDRITFHYAQYI